LAAEPRFIPALKYRWLTPFFDPLIRLTLPEERFKRELVSGAGIQEGHQVLDVGCGTGTLMIMIKKACPGATVWGLDADRNIIRLAKDKALRQQIPLFFHRGSATKMDYPDASFNRVVSSLFFHHLTQNDKLSALREVYRVLLPAGELHIADWGKPQNALMRAAFLLVQLFDGFETTSDNIEGRLPDLMRTAGFENIEEGSRFMTVFGTLALYHARKNAV
jgi:cyclopropane fatty-acyl-phospholipid synthase-like methyltransferase